MSEADAGWFLRHRDGVEHGPFRLADIVAAAQEGNVAEDTAVRHSNHTRNAWVLAPRVQPIATAMSRQDQSASPAEQTNPSPASKSAFRRPLQQPPSSITSTLPRRSTTTGGTSTAEPTPVASGAATAPLPSAAATSIRVRELAFPVPKTFVDAVFALFDFRFRYFVTPWIIKILWALAVGGALLWTTKLTYDYFIQPSVRAPGPKINDVDAPGWEFEPLEGQSIFQTRLFLFAVQAGTIGLLLLCIRVTLELSIVFFRVASDVGELKRLLRSERE